MRKFKLTLPLLSVFFVGLPSLWAQQRMPVIQNLGIIPVQYEGELPRSDKASFEEDYATVVKRAQRFRIINEDLVKANWPSLEGREELVREYELQAYVSLNVVIQDETVRLIARLLDPDLKVLMTETRSMSTARLTSATHDDVIDQLRGLIFSLFNRLPVDITVTSVQGSYISLSGGEVQNVRVGDVLEIKRPMVSSLHPADSSWLSFSTPKQGVAKVVDVKKQTSIALIVSQTSPGAISVGDGIKVVEIPGRAHFFSTGNNEFRDAGVASTQIVKRITKNDAAPAQVSSSGAMVSEPVTPLPASKEDQPGGDAPTEGSDNQLDMPRVSPPRPRNDYDAYYFYAGMRQWSISGVKRTESKLSSLLIDHFSVRRVLPFMPKWDLDGTVTLSFGNTKKGSYMGIKGSVAAFQEQKLKEYYHLNLRYGPAMAVETLGVEDESYGGGDYAQVGGFASLGRNDVALDLPLSWSVKGYLMPLGFGRMGYAGKQRNLSTLSAYILSAEALVVAPREPINWGGGLSFENLSARVGRNISGSAWSIYGVARF